MDIEKEGAQIRKKIEKLNYQLQLQLMKKKIGWRN